MSLNTQHVVKEQVRKLSLSTVPVWVHFYQLHLYIYMYFIVQYYIVSEILQILYITSFECCLFTV